MAIVSRFGDFEAGPAAPGQPVPERPTTEELLHALRHFLYEMKSDNNADADLVARLRSDLLRRYANQPEMTINFSVGRSWPRELPAGVAANLYRVVEEAVNNARQHGGATQLALRLHSVGGSLEVVLTDNGRHSTDLGESRFRGVGTLGLRDRVNALGGELDVQPGPTGTTRVRVSLPYQPA